MKRPLLLLPLLSLLPLARGVITNNVPISAMTVTTNVEDDAYFPLIQPYPGRTTNDNFRATTSAIFNGRGSGSFTNLTINNLTVVSNLFLTNVTVQEFSTTNIFNDTVTYITNSFLVISNTTVTINGTNVATINPTVGRLPYNVDGANFGDSALFFIDPSTVGAAEVDAGLVAITNLANSSVLITKTIAGIDGVLTNVPNASGALTNDGAGNFGWGSLGATINPTDGFLPYRSNATTFGDSPFAVISPGLVLQKSQLNVGTKGTIAYRTATNQADVTVETDIGGIQSVTYMGTGVGITTPLRVQVSGVPYFDVRNTGPVDFIGFDDGGGVNFSRGAIYHTGTNGSFVIESQANGTAGGARSIELVVDGDQVAIPYNPDTANTAYGFRAMNNANSSSQNNNAFGYNSLLSLTSGTENTAVGLASLLALQTGHHNTAIGNATLLSNNGDLNTAVGNSAGYTNSTGTGNTYLGYNANPLAGSDDNSTVIGRNTVGKGSNTALIGNSSVTVLWLGGEVGWFKGTGSPEGVVTAPPGSFYSNKSGGANVSFYVKESGSGNTGWIAK